MKIVRLRGLYDRCQSDDIDLNSRSQVRLKLDYFFLILQYIRQYLRYYIHTWYDGRLMVALYDPSRFDDPDLDATPQWVGKGKTLALHALGN